ncbi:DUF1223 domain-containing protein [Pedobacter fastidiosus]|uniref:DUF1223 domain-containing protein n=1 Tax=Pedobacter fastidiosus TaxID=2765361 RepID=A0ABR7KTI5_9SPHI|nr:DUF1223 domain-containing protein [Pedobacter fastidiosus]MBC6111424.1 DUF1223 domain-containing protein [Pedobacter fastidiosus]
MIKKMVLPLIAICAIGLALAFNIDRKISPNHIYSKETGFAVVELFTSEGCSSCPPADALVAKIEKESDGKSIYILAYHVDYWDRLGWKDTFSDAKFSARQNQYADWLNLKTVYTPQIVVNGSKEFVGSEEEILRKSISTELAKPNTNNLEISLNKSDEKKLILNYKTNQKTDGYNLIIALVSPMATNKILRGENKGKTLSHIQIVRQFETINLNGKSNGSANITVTNAKQEQVSEIIAFLQNNSTGRITAASRLNITASENLTAKSN